MKELKRKYTKVDSPNVEEWIQFDGKGRDMIKAIEDIIKNNEGCFAEEEIAELKSISNQIGAVLDDLSGFKRKRADGTGLKWRSV